MATLRNGGIEKIGDTKILNVTDYMGDTDLAKSDVLSFELENGKKKISITF